MPDKVDLFVDGIKIEHFISYQIDADLYTPADAFLLEIANPKTGITPGVMCELYINEERELTGIIDKIQRKAGKSGVSLFVEGRDFMGLLVDSYCETFPDVSAMKNKALAELLLANVPFINRKDILYQEGVVGKKKGKNTRASGGFIFGTDTAQPIGHIDAGKTIFEVLKEYASSRGLLFYCQPDGKLVFGRPLSKGSPEFTLQLLKDGRGNNVLESDVTYDISRRYSKVIVIGQQQGKETLEGVTHINTSYSKTDGEFPFYKPFVTIDNNDGESPKERARMIMERQRREGTQLIYKVARHSQNGLNWAFNRMCHVRDEVQGINGDYLIYGRTFALSKESGPVTTLSLGEPGVIN